MKTILALFALILIPAAALAVDAKAEPTVYEDTWLGIKYYDVADVLKYDGEDKELCFVRDALKTAKTKSGVILAELLPVTNQKTKSPYKISAFSIIKKIGAQKITGASSMQAFAKHAKSGSVKIEYLNFSMSKFQGNYDGDGAAIFSVPEKSANPQ